MSTTTNTLGLVIAGFGGQGVLFAGQLLAYAALDAQKHVTWIPSYGPEMRGGTANCTVVISDEEIGSPLVKHPQAVIALNQPSLDKYEPMVAAGGLLLFNADLVTRPPTRCDIHAVGVPAETLAEGLGARNVANMVLVGALLARTGVLPLSALEHALREHISARKQHLLEINFRALQAGMAALAVPA